MSRFPRSLERDPARTILVGGAPLDVIVGSEDTQGAFSLSLGQVLPGGGPPPHVHSREEEFFYLLEGSLDATAAGERFHAEAGTFLCLPRGLAHGFVNASKSAPASMLGTFAPAGGEQLLVEQSPVAGPPPASRLSPREVAAKYGVEILPPGADLKESTLDYARGRHPTVVAPGEGDLRNLGGFSFTIKVGTEETAGTYTAMELRVEPGAELPGLSSDVFELVAHVIDGALVADHNGTEVTARSGQSLSLPRGVTASLRAGSGGATALVVSAPAGLERILRASASSSRRTGLQRLAEAGRPLGLYLAPGAGA
ncbi:cupin domain-containing protein [Dactylosporangium sp. CA-092794]|uniref:cupin domain-containing protein n=1 Tax=Dactylosporangium sp. CA-092794 TaxID=3239929 RepID=UPI003D90E7EC